MSTTQNAKSNQPPVKTKPSTTTDSYIDALKSPEVLQQVASLFEPLIEFHQPDEGMTMDDVKVYWDVRAIRGKDTAFAHIKGTSTLNMMLAPCMMIEAPCRAEQEITDKITKPMAGVFQDYVTRVALEEVAAKEAALDRDDLTDDDLR